MCDISVIIPSHNRSGLLKRTLQFLNEQTYPRQRFETIVVNDGSTDETETVLRQFQDTAGYKLKYISRPQKGPAAARNRGVVAAESDYILFIGDDIFPEKDLIAQHVASLRQHPEAAVLGFVDWCKDCGVTDFMRYAAPNGFQFKYGAIKNPDDCDFRHFYTSNISLAKKWLIREPFDEDFPYGALEDTELSYRLKKKGLRIIFNEQAIGYHFHPLTLESFCRRMRRTGVSAAIMLKKCPELRQMLLPVNATAAAMFFAVLAKMAFIEKVNRRLYWYCKIISAYLEGIKPGRQHVGLLVLLTVFLAFPVQSYAYKLGNVDITLKGKISELYDDNISYVGANKRDDFITTISFGADARREGKTGVLDISGNIRRQFFAGHNDYDNNSGDFTLTFLNEFSKFDRVSIKDSFSRVDEPRSFEDAFGRSGGRYSSCRNSLGLTYSRDITRQLGFSIRYSNKADAYSRDDLADSYLNSAGLEAGYALNSRSSFFTSYDFSRRDFYPGAYSSTHSPSAGLRQYITSRLYFDGKIGENFITSYNHKEYAKPAFAASFTNDIDQNTSANVSFVKQYSAASYAQDLFNSWQVSGSLSRRLLERLGGAVSGFYGRGSYVSAAVSDEFSGINAGLTYDLGRDWQGSLSYLFSGTSSNMESREYRKNTFSFGLSAQF